MATDRNGIEIEIGDVVAAATTGRSLEIFKVHDVTAKSAGRFDGRLDKNGRFTAYYKANGNPSIEWYANCYCIVIQKHNDPNFKPVVKDYEKYYVGN